MLYKQTTQVPNFILDEHLPTLLPSELKILLVIIRQTFGWLDCKTGTRKTKDRISISQFILKTGLSKRIITQSIQALLFKRLIRITDSQGIDLPRASDRKGKTKLYYALSIPEQPIAEARAKTEVQPGQKSYYNKTNYTKLRTKINTERSHISNIISSTQGTLFK